MNLLAALPLRRWWMAGDVRPALQTPDNNKCLAGQRAAAAHCLASAGRCPRFAHSAQSSCRRAAASARVPTRQASSKGIR